MMNYKDMKVMIVDDVTENLQTASTVLKELGTKFIFAKNGQECIQRVSENTPDIILLDIMMPIMDGFETCKCLKEDPVTQNIPIIFLSAFHANDDIINGFELGSVDYIAKPFQPKELIARVKTHLNIVLLHRDAIENTKYNTMSKLAGGLIHEINTPLTPIKGSLEMIQLDLKSLEDSDPKRYIIEEINSIEKNLHKIEKLSNSIHELIQPQDDIFEQIDIYHLIKNTLIFLYGSFKQNIKVTINDEEFDLDYEPKVQLYGFIQGQRLSQGILAIIKNSIDAINSNHVENGKIEIFVKKTNGIIIIIKDNGGGIDSNQLKTLFENPLQSDKSFGGLGISLCLTKNIIIDNKGDIDANNNKNGLETTITLPLFI